MIVENGEAGSDMAEKAARGRRKHSLPQQLDSVGIRQVSSSSGSHSNLGYLLLKLSVCSFVCDKHTPRVPGRV